MRVKQGEDMRRAEPRLAFHAQAPSVTSGCVSRVHNVFLLAQPHMQHSVHMPHMQHICNKVYICQKFHAQAPSIAMESVSSDSEGWHCQRTQDQH